jgi:mono/diheme cytochrome c family protein
MAGSSLLVFALWFSFLPSVRGQAIDPTNQTMQASKDLYLAHCASCHGSSAKGDGPVASALKSPPTDLTMLAARNGGAFPERRVLGAITAGPSTPAHGSSAMPVWGPIFREVTGAATEAEVQLKIHNLMEYIRTLQQKPR